ncbi:NADP-dependent phosphogluconate dehydrogenase [Cecembia calidifontis]|uniref:6-phosphogluconate dehydrogenase, decarboxylating n=1 Tax=Cecembia calidifontis TaxID=1187080 RepID=A0A4Q7P9L4_9BACT|nr:NADP-dependent phosphogluconate dehydrogenase [Cecembia calidifontis]RZS96607.1 6-phosphogluconate dehydrogenase [Cecembia calidifontis]
MICIVTGVSGSGKTTIGTLLSEKIKLPFFDADDFHPSANVEKMSQGIPLTDMDRMPWLNHLAEKIQEWEKSGGAILACSALKEAYRSILQSVPHNFWIHLQGEKLILEERLRNRKNHYMPPGLLTSQLDTWEQPAYGLHLDIKKSPEELVQTILDHIFSESPKSHVGIIGMGVMGKSLALNMAEKGIPVAVYNRHVPGKEEKIASDFAAKNQQFPLLQGFDDLEVFVSALELPRKILLMIPAGEAIDLQIEQLLPLINEGDIIIDGGNSFFEDSNRRSDELSKKGIHFLPMGVSGGEEGARKGPSLMPSGNKAAYDLMSAYLEKIAAKDKKGMACVTYVGPQGAGHFIKMVHNSIEYGEMQAIAETVHLLRFGLKLSLPESAKVLRNWITGGLKSYFLEITADILEIKENNEFLLDMILDQAEQKGTGGWSIQTALKYNSPYSSLFEAVTARQLSANKKDRSDLSQIFHHRFRAFAEDKVLMLEHLKNAYALTRIINHETGFKLMQNVSDALEWNLNFSEIARIWTNGCIIRSSLMEDLAEFFQSNHSIFHHKALIGKIKEWKPDLAYIVGMGLQHDFALPVMSASLNYLLGRITDDSSANLIQAQRDYFGAHTYKRKDDPEGLPRHTDWTTLKYKQLNLK